MRRTSGWIGLLLTAVLVVGGCGDDAGGDESQVRSDLEASLVASGLVTEDDVDCLLDRLFADYDVAELESLAATGEPSEELIADIATYTEACHVGPTTP